jgi:hypothetical protein
VGTACLPSLRWRIMQAVSNTARSLLSWSTAAESKRAVHGVRTRAVYYICDDRCKVCIWASCAADSCRYRDSTL